MRHMGISGKIAIWAFLAALGLLVLTGITLHETVFLWFIVASAAAYVACVAEVVVRRRHKTLAACGLGSILFIAFGIAFLRQWGLAFNPDPDALSTRVDSAHPDMYFYLAAAAGAFTLLLLFAGTVLPGRSLQRLARQSPARRPAPASRAGSRSASPRPSAARPTPRTTAGRPAAPRAVARPAAKAATKAPVRSQPTSPAGKSPSAKSTTAKTPVKPPTARTPARPADRTSPRR